MKLEKSEIIKILMREFRRAGYDGLSLSQISNATGLGKASLYHHFPGGKDEMALEVMNLTDQWVQAEVISALKSDQTPATRLKTALRALEAFYDSGRRPCLFEIMIVGEVPEPIRKKVHQSLESLVDAFTKTAKDLGFSKAKAKNLAENAVIIIQGGLILCRGTQNLELFHKQLKQIEERFLSGA